MSEKPTKPPGNITATHNLMVGQGTFIKISGGLHSIKATDNVQVGNGTFIESVSDEAGEQPKPGGLADKLKLAAVIELIKTAFAFLRRLLGL